MKPSWEVCGECNGRKYLQPTTCDNCGGPLETHTYPSGPHPVELENCAGFKSYGGYGWFHDDAIFHPGEEPETIYFCHDCCVKLFIMFPAFERAYGSRGLHPVPEGHISCCKYSWKFEDRNGIEGVRFGDGTWEPCDKPLDSHSAD